MTLSGGAKVGFVVAGVIGVVLIIGGGVVNGVFPGIYKKQVAKNLILEEKGEATGRFEVPPVSAYMKFYFFNVTNPGEVNDEWAKPNLTEIGPFVYKQVKTKNITRWNAEEGVLDYVETTSYYYEPKLTGDLDINEEIYHINAADMGVVKILTGGAGMPGAFNYFNMLKEMTNPAYITDSLGPLIVKHKINEILFEGYSADVFSALKELPDKIDKKHAFFVPILKKDLSGKIPPDGKFSVFGDRNNTQGPLMTVYTGKEDISKLTVLQKINGKSQLNFFQKNTTCDMINGTDGMQFHPDMSKDTNIYVYSPDVCRSLEFEYERTVKVRDIEALRFKLLDSVFQDPNDNGSANHCFCKEKNTTECTKKGLLPMAYCMPDKPVLAMSAPHLQNAADEYLNEFIGLNPNINSHETYIDIEPTTGQVIRGAKRLQVNIMEDFIEGFDMVNKTERRRPFPLFWLEEGGELDDKLAEELRSRVIAPKQAVTWGSIAAIAIGVVIICISAVLFFLKH